MKRKLINRLLKPLAIISPLGVKAMGRSAELDPLQKFNFSLTIPGLPTGLAFSKISGLKREINVVDYNEGGLHGARKLQGREKVDPIVCERGCYLDGTLEAAYKDSLTNKNFRQTIVVGFHDKDAKLVRSWTLLEAWVSVWEGPEFDASSDDVTIEKLTIVFEQYQD
jgi:phage tail-like protein